MAEPKVIPAGKPRVVRAGKPKVILTNTNVHPAGIPKVVIAGVPKVCTPGQDSFSLPKIVPAIDSPFLAGIPEVVIAQNASTKDQNPQNFSSFGKLQGLKHNYISCLYEDKIGNLWFGTLGGGVSKYDGKSFTHFTEKEGLSQNDVYSILEDKSGNLWFGTFSGGVSKYDGKSFTHFTKKEGLSHNFVGCILEDKNGNLWFGTRGGGVSKYDPDSIGAGGKRFTHFTEKEGLSNNSVWCILEDTSGNLWFGTNGGVSKYDASGDAGNSFTHFTEKEGLSNNYVRSILEDTSGNLWFGTAGGRVSKYDGKSFTHYTDKEGLSNNIVRSMLEDKSGNLWFGTNGGGVSKYDPDLTGTRGKSFTHYTEKEGLNNNNVSSILEDKSGNLWFGTNGAGMNIYNGKRLTHFTEKEGLSSNFVRSILKDKSGNLWFGGSGGVSKYDGKSFTHFTVKEGLINNDVKSILKDKSGNLWFGGSGGVSKYDGKSFTQFTMKEGLSSNFTYSILEDKNGNLWFGTLGGGVSKYDGKSFTHFTDKEGLSNNRVYSILEDKNGNLWFGTGKGVSKYDGKSFTHFTEKEGLSQNDVYSILEDKRGNLWFGTLDAGVIKYDGKSFTHFTEKEGLSNNSVVSIMEDKSGSLWFGTRFGLNKLEEDKLSAFTITSAGKPEGRFPFNLSESGVFFKTYTYEDGFLGIGLDVGKILCEAKDGTIWIGADDRLTVFHPTEETPDTIAPNIQLTSLALFSEKIAWQGLEKKKDTSFVLSNGVRVHDFYFEVTSRWYGVPEDLSLSYNNNNLTFQYVGITTQAPKKVKYQYKLEGLDKNWSGLTNRSEATYSNLGHGKYTFKVKAMNGEGYWSKELAYSFVIRPPWWLTWWAYGIYGLLLGVAVLLVHRYQKQRIIRIEQEKAQKKELELGKEIEKAYHKLEESHENLKTTQSQLIQSEKMASLGELTAGIAHEIQNPLNFVNNFSDLNKELLEEIKGERSRVKGERNEELEGSLLENIIGNEEKINHHGKRADAIVKSMLQHSSISNGQKEMTDINALADEYLRLAYHGLRAKDKDFNANMKTDFNETIDKVNIISQDLGRVLLNLINNAFYAVSERKKQNVEGYEPTVSVSTKKIDNKVLISVKDNGNGIPQKVLDKIFQPFFTTKPTGQGTGLGLSLAYDIIKAHGGDIKVESEEGLGTEFIVSLPI